MMFMRRVPPIRRSTPFQPARRANPTMPPRLPGVAPAPILRDLVPDLPPAKDGPTFSVVIPTYNRTTLLPKTLATVFEQAYPTTEILVVDNCSTDDTEQVLAPLIAA